MFANGVSENVFLLSMRSDILWTDPNDYVENYISVANQRDEYERANYPRGIWIVRIETDRLKGICGGAGRCTLGRFRSSEGARKFVASRTNPESVPVKLYSAICDCLAWKYLINYKECKGIIFEQCAHCGNPTKEIFRTPLNKLVTDDFNLDEFLGL